MLKRVLTALLAGVMLALTVTAAPETAGETKEERKKFTLEEINERAAVPSFPDAAGHWAEAAINRFAAAGIVRGDGGLFRPDDPMTRAEFAVVLNRIMRYKTVSGDLFTDLKEDWYADACQALRFAGVLRGDENNLVHPDDPVSREEAVTLFARAFNLENYDSEAELTYADADEIQGWARGNVAALTAEGYLHGSDGNCFFPADPLTRAECVTILDNMITAFFYEPGDYDYRSFEGLANFVIIGANDVNVMYFDMGKDVLLTEAVDYTTIRLTGCNLFDGRVLDYQSDGTTVRRLKSSSTLFAIDGSVSRCTHNRDLFTRDERNVVSYGDANVKTWFGVDVSSHQGDVDWARLKQEGVYFAFIRVGYRGYTDGTIYEDAYFEKNVAAAHAAGIKVGAYFFSQATNAREGLEEAEFTLKRLNGLPISFPVVFDWERITASRSARSYRVETEALCAAATAFCDAVSAAGYKTMLYSNLHESQHQYYPAFLARYDFWYADYTPRPQYYYDYQIWQYGSYQFPGVQGLIDLNISFVDYSAGK